MPRLEATDGLYNRYIVAGNHAASDYFGLIKELVALRNASGKGSDQYQARQAEIDGVYELIHDEVVNNHNQPRTPIKFGTSGWRGIIGKDIIVDSVVRVTMAIIAMYQELDDSSELAQDLGVVSLAEARTRGCVLGFDNRFAGKLMADSAAEVLTGNGFMVYYAGESTTGALSAAVLRLKAAFSINLTPSHNPLEYGGFKYNAADAGPAAPTLTDCITRHAVRFTALEAMPVLTPEPSLIKEINALDNWIDLVRANRQRHGLDYDGIVDKFSRAEDMAVVVDCVHGASRIHVRPLFKGVSSPRLELLRGDDDKTFGGIAPEPSSANLAQVTAKLREISAPLKLGVIIDPDGDRIRFTDGSCDISMNQFGAMAYHFLSVHKKRKGLVAKTVATSNFANALATAFGQEVFEPRVGFKEFKPVIDRALVCFEESDGVTVIGHTPEKDAYIGLFLALDMMLTLGKNLGDYLRDIQQEYGVYFPAKDGVTVTRQGPDLLKILAGLEKYSVGSILPVGETARAIIQVIDIDGRKMILEDKSWLMIRPSGTEPKVRFYVEARNQADTLALFATARSLLAEIGLL